MPVSTAPDPWGRFEVLLITSPYSFAEWTTAVLELFNASLFLQTRAVLVDRRDSSPATPRFVDDMVNFFARHIDQFAGVYVAIVTSDTAAYGMGRMTELKAQGRNPTLVIQTFRDYDEAVDWLEKMRGASMTEKLSRDAQARLVEAALQGGDVRCHHGGEWIWKKMAVVVGPDLYACAPSRRDCPDVPHDRRGDG